ncbi:MAG: hypothetical protein EOO01_20615 [Chitinophagaceae bacterium]|nr:MAG: hypothetical protein EOO01_20615 [Chitinophagaceae bacterium]
MKAHVTTNGLIEMSSDFPETGLPGESRALQLFAEHSAAFVPKQLAKNETLSEQGKVCDAFVLVKHGILHHGFEIDDLGNIELPLLGSFNVSGKTLKETEASIQKKAQGLFKEVSTKIRLLNYKFTIVGEVKKPGVYYNYSSTITVIDAIARAEGITEFALVEEVLVLRPNNNKQDVFVLNLNNKSSLVSEGFYLMPDDKVILKPAKNKNRQLRSQAQNWIIPSVSAILVLLNFLKNN